MSKRNILIIVFVIVALLLCSAGITFALWPTDYTSTEKDLSGSGGHWNESADFYVFELNADGASYSVTGFKGLITNLEIPSAYNDLPVTAIRSSFNNLGTIYKVIIPSTITLIEDNAFVNSLTLTSLTIEGDSGLTIGRNAFRGCPELASVTYTAGRIASLGEGAFENCDKLTERPIV